jgi:endo-1,4-beta-mannosidase
MMENRKVRFGVNYTPSRRWWYCWIDWDKDSIQADLEDIASLGADHMRIHCLWPLFQPNPSLVSENALDRLVELLDMADSYDLDVEITVLNGFLSGYSFFPFFFQCFDFRQQDNAFADPDIAEAGKLRNVFTDDIIIQSEKTLFAALAKRIGDHPRFLGFDLGNELSVLRLFNNEVDIETGDEWFKEMIQYCNGLSPGKLHVNGVDHKPWFQNAAFSRHALANWGALTSLHAWVGFSGAMKYYQPLDVGCTHLLEYCIELAKAYSDDPRRSVWIQEFGATSKWMPPEMIPELEEQIITNALDCDDLWGFTWWSSHELNRELAFCPYEYDFGLFQGHEIKNTGKKYRELIARYKNSCPEAVERTKALVLSENHFDAEAKPEPGWSFGMAFMQLVADGVRPAVVHEKRVEDKKYLNSRGIEELILPGDLD